MKTICFIEDDYSIQKYFEESLAEEYKILFAANAREAIPHLVLEPSLFVIDKHLPDLNGLEVTRLVRTLFPTVPIVLLTNGTHVELTPEIGGATTCVKTPLNSKQLKDLIADLLK